MIAPGCDATAGESLLESPTFHLSDSSCRLLTAAPGLHLHHSCCDPHSRSDACWSRPVVCYPLSPV